MPELIPENYLPRLQTDVQIALIRDLTHSRLCLWKKSVFGLKRHHPRRNLCFVVNHVTPWFPPERAARKSSCKLVSEFTNPEVLIRANDEADEVADDPPEKNRPTTKVVREPKLSGN